MKRLALLLALACSVAAAQGRYPSVNVVQASPVGTACPVANELEQYLGDIYTCDPVSGFWRITGGAGSGSVGFGVGGQLAWYPSSGFSVAGVSLSGLIGVQAPGQFLASPISGPAGPMSIRTLASSDIPNNGANTTGNAGTATALASPPNQCTGSAFAQGIQANGNANCATPSNSGNMTDGSGLSTGAIPKATATAHTYAASACSDNGTTFGCTEPVSTGATPPSVTFGTGGGHVDGEGTAPSTGFPAAGVDGCYADATAHAYKCSDNNGSLFISAMNLPYTGAGPAVPTGPTSSTSGDAVKYTGTAGQQADSGLAMPAAAGSATVTQTIASGTATLGTSAISSATCASVVTVSATGVATTDAITFNFNADPTSTTGYAPSTSGTLFIYGYPTSGNVNFKVCNNTAGSITPGAATLNWRVVR